MSDLLSVDTQAILLLCGRFGHEDQAGIEPLSPALYDRLARWLNEQNLRPSFLLEPGFETNGIEETGIEPTRIDSLLQRGAAMAFTVENWTNRGLWIMSRADNDYPIRFRQRLKAQAPPILYGIGDPHLLKEGGLAIVGSRDLDDAGREFVTGIAQKAAQENITVISGGARGADQAAMLAALDAQGASVGVLADRLLKNSVNGAYRDAIRDQRLVLISPYSPDAPFNVGNAMGRNKLIYTLADWALVASSGEGKGGTWAGATENLKKAWVPLFVRAGEQIPPGNQRLMKQGGAPIDAAVVASPKLLRETFTNLSMPAAHQPHLAQMSTATDASSDCKPEEDIYRAVWPIIVSCLDEPRSLNELRDEIGDSITEGQLRIWIERALETGVIKKTNRPVRYVRTPNHLSGSQRALFDSIS